MISNGSLSDSKSHYVSRTLLSILADINNAVVWIVFTCPLIFKSSSPFTNPLRIVPSAPITIGITITFMFHSYFSSLAKSRYLSFFSLSFNFICGLPIWQSSLFSRFSFLLLSITRSSWDLVICLYLKIPENFVHLILQDSLHNS